MRYNTIRKMDISNGPGVRVSIFMQGCPFHCKNCFNQETWDFSGGKEFKEKYPNKNLWAWSGFKYEDLKSKDVLKYVDVLVDGTYKDELHDPTLKWKGSSNQRVIDVQKSMENQEICLLK